MLEPVNWSNDMPGEGEDAVTPAVRQQLMRHASIETTLKIYVEQDADVLGAELWEFDARPEDSEKSSHSRSLG